MIKSFLASALFLCSFLFTKINAQSMASIDNLLQERMEKNPEDTYSIFVWMNDKLDLDHFKLTHRSDSPNERSIQLIKNLMAKADESKRLIYNRLLSVMSSEQRSTIKWNYITNGFQVFADRSLIQELRTWPEVYGIYSEMIGNPDFEKNSEIMIAPLPNASEPGLSAINAPALWTLGYTGYGRKAYIFDSGEDYKHPAIRAQFRGNHKGLSSNWSGGHDKPFDVFGHGTHVTGTICGLDRLKSDTIGVAFDATWMGGPVQFSRADVPKQPYSVKSFIDNMEYALNPDGDENTVDDMPDVINNSWSGFRDCSAAEPFSEVIKALEIAGIANVWSAGNDGPDAATLGGYQNVNYSLISGFSIGATQTFSPYEIADFSSRGPSLCPAADATDPLSIKPEVSAPGVAVRSSVLDGKYSNYNGTSMASPHVSGAILLLKEAFPYLSGDDFLYALYYSAIDLGAIGEDNVYGRGIIDVFAAYNYLIGLGNIPVSPASKENDIMVLDLIEKNQEVYCKGNASFTAIILNNGVDTIKTFELYASKNNGGITSTDTIMFVGNLAPQDTARFDFSDLNYPIEGESSFEIEVSAPDFRAEERTLNNKWVRSFEVKDKSYLTAFVTENQLICKGSNVSISPAEGDNLVKWYSQAKGGEVISSNKTFISAALTKDTSFYYDVIENYTAGMSYDLNTSSNSNKKAGLTFDVFSDLYLNSVKVFVITPSTYLFNVTNGDGDIFYSAVLPLSVGEQTLNINAYLPIGSGYNISMILGKSLGVNNNEVSFPYEIAQLLRIKESFGFEATENQSTYAYFFDWDVDAPNLCGRQEIRVMVDTSLSSQAITILGPDSLDLSTGQVVSFTPSTLDVGYSYEWSIDDESSTSVDIFDASFADLGTYAIKLKTTNPNGCTSFSFKRLFVYDRFVSTETAPAFSINIWPNPVKDFLFVTVDNNDAGYNFSIFDLGGKLMLKNILRASNNGIDVSNLIPGMYIIHYSNNNQTWATKFVKQ